MDGLLITSVSDLKKLAFNPVVEMLKSRWCLKVLLFAVILFSVSLSAPTIEDTRRGISYLRRVKGADVLVALLLQWMLTELHGFNSKGWTNTLTI